MTWQSAEDLTFSLESSTFEELGKGVQLGGMWGRLGKGFNFSGPNQQQYLGVLFLN